MSQRSIQLKDQRSGMPCMASIANHNGSEVYVIGPILLSLEDVLRLAEHAILNGPADNDLRRKFVTNVTEYTTGEGLGGVKVFRPSVIRSLAGTAPSL